MEISARISTEGATLTTRVETNGASKAVAIPPREGMNGSSINGGELLLLALGTCFCNDLYREAGPRSIEVTLVEVRVEGQFGGVGEPARTLQFHVRVEAHASEEAIVDLILHTDRVAEIQNTLRLGMPVNLATYRAVSIAE